MNRFIVVLAERQIDGNGYGEGPHLTVEVEGSQALITQSGALVIKNKQGSMVRAFGEGVWDSVERDFGDEEEEKKPEEKQ